MSRGPLDLVVLEFPGDVPGEQLAPQLARAAEQGAIRVIDIAFVRKNSDATVETFELHERQGHPSYEALDPAVHALDGLIADDDLAQIGNELAPGHTAGVLLVENLWAAQIRQTVLDAGGQILLAERIPAPVVEALAAVSA